MAAAKGTELSCMPMITLTINGKERQIEEPATVADYIASLGLDTQHVAVARNGEVLERSKFASVTLAEGDTLEIVRPIGGG
jgi:thiamine biosynthesis protein ThiS